jgi:type VI protein secretion system component Hcp
MPSKILSWPLAVLSLIITLTTWPSAAAADIQGFMTFPGLPGESQVKGHEGQIDVVSYTQVAGAAGCFKAIVIKGLDKASPGLAVLAVSNQVVTPVTINLEKSGATPFTVFTAVLENVVVGTVELVEMDGTPVPTERVTLKPRRATLSYRLQNPDGTPGAPITSVVNCP